MSDYVPQDILIGILTKLSVKSLIRFRCVSKSWYSLISDSSFISTHINCNKDNNHGNHLLVKRSASSQNKENYFLHYGETFVMYKQLNCPFKNNTYLKIVGSCNGLLCLSNDIRASNDMIILWNPSIRKYEILPKPNITCKNPDSPRPPVIFGFDPLTNDYKVVRIIYFRTLNETIRFQPKVELYELSKGLWRSISVTVPPCLLSKFSTQTYMNGAVHWIAFGNSLLDNYHSVIVLFNMIHEEFGKMMLPDNVANADVLSMSISAIGDSLWLLHNNVLAPSAHCSIWVMKEYGVQESWTKQFTIHLDEGLEKVVGFMKNGEVLLTTCSEKLVSYDPKDQEIKYFSPHGSNFLVDLDTSLFYADIYLESLVLLNQGNGILTRPDAITCKRLPAWINRMIMWISCANIGGSKKKRLEKQVEAAAGDAQGCNMH